jgi:hypothetical protein
MELVSQYLWELIQITATARTLKHTHLRHTPHVKAAFGFLVIRLLDQYKPRHNTLEVDTKNRKSTFQT